MATAIEKENKALLRVAASALKKAYATYSRFKVGAAVKTRAGGTYAGCNVENASYSIVSCAERNAIAAAVLAEGPRVKITAVALDARDEE